ncbi:MAG: hypothetical protein AVDCRST_MAG70-370, partial [uncultured Thermomicrobiales bacterium]
WTTCNPSDDIVVAPRCRPSRNRRLDRMLMVRGSGSAIP